jgi:hypothetical protein
LARKCGSCKAYLAIAFPWYTVANYIRITRHCDFFILANTTRVATAYCSIVKLKLPVCAITAKVVVDLVDLLIQKSCILRLPSSDVARKLKFLMQ